MLLNHATRADNMQCNNNIQKKRHCTSRTPRKTYGQ